MSEENVETVRRVFDAVARGDTTSILALYDRDVVWDNSRSVGGALTAPGLYHGHEGLREWFRLWAEPWENLSYHHGELIDAGEQVVVAATMTGRGRGSGAEVKWTQYAVWTIRDRRIARVVWFPSRQEALEAVGLRE